MNYILRDLQGNLSICENGITVETYNKNSLKIPQDEVRLGQRDDFIIQYGFELLYSHPLKAKIGLQACPAVKQAVKKCTKWYVLENVCNTQYPINHMLYLTVQRQLANFIASLSWSNSIQSISCYVWKPHRRREEKACGQWYNYNGLSSSAVWLKRGSGHDELESWLKHGEGFWCRGLLNASSWCKAKFGTFIHHFFGRCQWHYQGWQKIFK